MWWDRWRAFWQRDVEVEFVAERDDDGVALIIQSGGRSQVYHLTDVMAANLAAQLGSVGTLLSEPRIETLQTIVALATAEIARIEGNHEATRVADPGGDESEP